MKADKLIKGALRLINVPGRGGVLSAEDQADAFFALQELLNSSAVSKQFVPGINRHFFTAVADKHIYTYGASTQADFRSDDFNDDPPPIDIEHCFMRQGSSITNNEKVNNYRFEAVGDWTEGGTAVIQNNQGIMEGVGTLTQNLSLSVTNYTIKIDLEVNVGDVELKVLQGVTELLNVTIQGSGEYSYDFTYSTGSPSVVLTTAAATDDIRINTLSIIETGKDRLELPQGQGTDYSLKMVGQTTYNLKCSKGQGGRPYNFVYSRNYPVSRLMFDNSTTAGELIVMDVLVNKLAIKRVTDEIQMHDDGLKWLRFALADSVAPEYGKRLNDRQLRIMMDAEDLLMAGNRRINNLRVDSALLYGSRRGHYNINEG